MMVMVMVMVVVVIHFCHRRLSVTTQGVRLSIAIGSFQFHWFVPRVLVHAENILQNQGAAAQARPRG